jgi:hypothetical protein
MSTKFQASKNHFVLCTPAMTVINHIGSARLRNKNEIRWSLLKLSLRVANMNIRDASCTLNLGHASISNELIFERSESADAFADASCLPFVDHLNTEIRFSTEAVVEEGEALHAKIGTKS